jgi:cell division septal protein FtsQ
MAKQKRFKGIKLPGTVKDLKDAVMNKAVNAALIVAFLAIIFILARAYIYHSDYFKVRSVETKEAFLDHKSILLINNKILDLYKGRNVFTVNLKYIASSLWRSYPDAKDIVVKVALPDKLVINMKFRKPVALVKGEKLYPIDEEGFVLPSVDPAMLSDLPVVTGVSLRYDEKRGGRSSSRNLRAALDLLRTIKESAFAGEYSVGGVNAGDGRNLVFYLKNGTEVRIGYEDFRDRLETLRRILKDPRLILDRVEYIDLRFGDAVIGPK